MIRTSRMSSMDDLNTPVDPSETTDSPSKPDAEERPRRRTDTLLLSTLRFVSVSAIAAGNFTLSEQRVGASV
jgi:hypothetical protein